MLWVEIDLKIRFVGLVPIIGKAMGIPKFADFLWGCIGRGHWGSLFIFFSHLVSYGKSHIFLAR